MEEKVLGQYIQWCLGWAVWGYGCLYFFAVFYPSATPYACTARHFGIFLQGAAGGLNHL